MLKISYAASPSLCQLISAQFVFEMCLAARNCQKKSVKRLFGVQGHWTQWQSRAIVRLPISD